MQQKQFTGAFRASPRINPGQVSFGTDVCARHLVASQDEIAEARVQPETTMRQEEISSLVVDWQALHGVLPVGVDAASIDVREKLFKELVVRSERLRERGGSRTAARSFRGTLSSKEVDGYLHASLARSGAIRGGDAELSRAMEKAFHTARRFHEPVSVFDGNHIDMNEFHVVAIHLAHYLDLRQEFLVRWAKSGRALTAATVAETQVQMQDIEPLLQSLSAPSFGSLRGSAWGNVDEFKYWATEPRNVFTRLVADSARDNQALGQVPFELFADLCLSRVISQMPTGGGQASRKHAFQLLQALNNTPSLPNAVPGPLGQQQEVTLEADAGLDTPSAAPTKPPWVLSRRQCEKPLGNIYNTLAPALGAYSSLDRGVRPTSTTWGATGVEGSMTATPRADGAGGVFASVTSGKRFGSLQLAGGIMATPR